MAFPKRGTTRTGTLSAGLLAIALITGCSDPSSDAEDKAAQPSSAQPSNEAPTDSAEQEDDSSSGQTRGGDGSEITLNALSEEDMRGASLPGELGCSFTTDDGEVLLIAMGNVASSDAAQGVVKVAGYVERVSAPGGFDGMTASPTFSGKGKTVHIEVTGEPTEGGESPPRPATLTYDRADGAQRDWQGEWRCGP
ncbi:MAG TPA: hypothetical protein DEQ58_11510 [Alcanivorax sp.]|nr:hypothetical protein [Alcanivorax sp.]MBF48352.1 hypothetical protein [Alcanivorax sp.]MBT76524.1 hypothetical protein [Alcanivorax sp.]HAI35013.1 hypothetical protein [Alcanivorax sp.]HBP67542.1 hypothetical protein [Alcanivorax sp.]|tara:strand:+ start:6357 stop:6941 length:585 start_codon:yes stop_codon:yes gene_type:complete